MSQFPRNDKPLPLEFSPLARRAPVCFHAGMPEAGNLKEAARPRPPAPKTLVPVSGSAGALRHCAAFTLALLGCLSCLAAEQRFFQQFLSFTASNPETWEVLSPLLVDTNNRGFKLTSILTNLAKLKTTASVAGVRPGMTMDEVVSQWGKPPEIWAKGFEGPRFCYKEVTVFFDSTGNAVKSIFTEDLPSLERSLSLTPRIEQCLRALGEPSFRDDTASGSQCWLIYEMTNMVLKVGCVRGRLSTLQVDRRE